MPSSDRQAGLSALTARIGACRVCRDRPDGGAGRALPHEPNPVCVLSASARLLICGQAPGTRVHASGRPFTDRSGDRLRAWTGLDTATFYDAERVAIVPMGFCFPGQDARGADLPPRPECRRVWHGAVFAAMPQVDLVLAVGRHAQHHHLPERRGAMLTETVAAWRAIVAETARAGRTVWPLPHPSWRNSGWLGRNPWFEDEMLPVLREAVADRVHSSE